MRIQTDDRSFAVLITPFAEALTPPDRRFFRMALELGGHRYGSFDSADIVWGALQQLADVKTVRTARLDPVASTPEQNRDTMQTNPGLNDHCLIQLGELFDRWVYRAYRYGDQVVFLFAEHDLGWRGGPIERFMVSADQYFAVVAVAVLYEASIAVHPSG